MVKAWEVAAISFLAGTMLLVSQFSLLFLNNFTGNNLSFQPNDPKEHPFNRMSRVGWSNAVDPRGKPNSSLRPNSINWTAWEMGTGGLTMADRLTLEKIYGAADSVFEYGLGESTLIANALEVPRYAGIDSDAVWVRGTAGKVSHHFRFYLGDIGPTEMWGRPAINNLTKALFDYQLSPLISEQDAFDVYMVDGRFRFACMMASFLHASLHGNPNPTVLIHDCSEDIADFEIARISYRAADELLDMVQHSGDKLCVFNRKKNTTDDQLYDFWYDYRYTEM